MGQAVFSDNTTIKVSAAISATSSSTGTVLYTAPSNGYAIIQASLSAAGTLTVGGMTVLNGASTVFGIYVGPSQSVVIATGTPTTYITGVEFKNSP